MQGPQTDGQLPLRDIHLPIEPGFWPLAPGWWVLIVVLLVLLIFLVVKFNQKYAKNQRFKAINQQLGQIHFQFLQNKNHHQLASQVSAFLRRFSKYQLNNRQASVSVGQAWIDYLNSGDDNKPFSAFQIVLNSGPFTPDISFDDELLIQTVRRFIKKHINKPAGMEA